MKSACFTLRRRCTCILNQHSHIHMCGSCQHNQSVALRSCAVQLDADKALENQHNVKQTKNGQNDTSARSIWGFQWLLPILMSRDHKMSKYLLSNRPDLVAADRCYKKATFFIDSHSKIHKKFILATTIFYKQYIIFYYITHMEQTCILTCLLCLMSQFTKNK